MRKMMSPNALHKRLGKLLCFSDYKFGLFLISLSCLSLFLYTHDALAAGGRFGSVGSDISAAKKNQKQNLIDDAVYRVESAAPVVDLLDEDNEVCPPSMVGDSLLEEWANIDRSLQGEWEKLRTDVNIYPGSSIKEATSAEKAGMGMILCSDGEVGTGTIMDVPHRVRDVIVTASHVLYDKGKERECYFFPRGNLSLQPIRLESPKFGNDKWWPGAANEWAVAALSTSGLSEPLAISKEYKAMKYSTILEDISIEEYNRKKNDFFFLGFNPGNKKVEKSYNCRPRVPTGNLKPEEGHIFHDCGSKGGYSGGPALSRSSKGTAVVCIHSGAHMDTVHRNWEDPFDANFNPNTCVRMTQNIVDAFTQLARSPNLQLVKTK